MTELDPRRWKALAVVCAAFFMTILDVSIVNVALPSIGHSLHFSRENLQWVITAYAITFGGFLLLGGRAADIFGRRRVFLVGVVAFTAASFVCGLAGSESVLIAARAVQGLGAAIISPSALAIVMTTFDEGAERNKALGHHEFNVLVFNSADDASTYGKSNFAAQNAHVLALPGANDLDHYETVGSVIYFMPVVENEGKAPTDNTAFDKLVAVAQGRG